MEFAPSPYKTKFRRTMLQPGIERVVRSGGEGDLGIEQRKTKRNGKEGRSKT